MAPDQVPPNNFPNTLANCAIRQYARSMTTPPEPRVEAAAKAILDDNPFNDEPGLWDVPSIKAHYVAIASAALKAADAADPLRSDRVIIVDVPDEPTSDIVLDYTYSPFGNDSDEDPEWRRTMTGDWKGYKDGGKEYLSWSELVRRWGPLAEKPIPKQEVA